MLERLKKLPWKKITVTTVTVVALFFIILLISGKSISSILHPNRFKFKPLVTTTTVGGIIEQDSNGNGIADWEETLWGLDPTVKMTKGILNEEIIKQKKAALQAKTGAVDGTQLSDTDYYTDQLMTTIFALKESDNLTPDSISKIADAFGTQIVTPKEQAKIYSNIDLKTVPSSSKNVDAYSQNIADILVKYQNDPLGNEMSNISVALANGDERPLLALPFVAQSYHNFALDLLSIPVPEDAANIHLSFINSIENLSGSVIAMETILDNPIAGIAALAKYQENQKSFYDSADAISSYFQEKGI